MVQSGVGNFPKADREVRVRQPLDHDVIVMASGRWDNPYASSALSLAKALSRSRRVFIMDNPVTLTEYLRKRRAPEMMKRRDALFGGDGFFCLPDKNNPSLIAVTPKCTLPVNWLSEGSVYSRLSGWNARRVAETVNRLCRIFGIRKYILVNSFNPQLGGVEKYLVVKPDLFVYQSVDDIAQAPFLQKHGVRLENRLIASADLTLVTSSPLLRLKQSISDRVRLLPNAADTALFGQAMKRDWEKPVDLSGIPKGTKVVTYVGNVCQRIDYVLLKKLAAAHPEKIFLMIGPLAPAYGNGTTTYARLANLDDFKNIMMIGARPMESLPAYLRHTDCCMIPFLCNDLTRSVYPLKINEYLSAGKPVVTTSFSEDVAAFSNVCYIAQNDGEFVSLIDKAIREDEIARQVDRVLASASNTWEARAHHFIELVGEFLKHKDGRIRQQV